MTLEAEKYIELVKKHFPDKKLHEAELEERIREIIEYHEGPIREFLQHAIPAVIALESSSNTYHPDTNDHEFNSILLQELLLCELAEFFDARGFILESTNKLLSELSNAGLSAMKYIEEIISINGKKHLKESHSYHQTISDFDILTKLMELLDREKSKILRESGEHDY